MNNSRDELETWDQAAIIKERRLYELKIEVLKSTKWLTEQQIITASGEKIDTLEWQRERRIFTININHAIDCTEYFPLYTLDPKRNYSPLGVMKEILCLFKHLRAGWELAYWFASANRFLDGKRPQHLLTTDPQRVLAAAADQRDGIGFLSAPLVFPR